MKKALLFCSALAITALGCGGSDIEAEAPSAETQPAPADDGTAAPAEAAAGKDIVDTAIAAGNFTTLVKAVQAAELVDALKQPGPLTVFAPTDEAFAKLPEGTIEALLQDKDKLRAVLTYHVVQGKIMAADTAGATEVTTLQGGTLPVDTSAGVKIGNATVIKADIETSNGVIHVIDT
ncbi:MAG: fasciclin domain-containing protein, partial [Deltaproteobacteria bacterium]|nr:fasciclin domain-containing protein [Deltaproteobacteria bacterium]